MSSLSGKGPKGGNLETTPLTIVEAWNWAVIDGYDLLGDAIGVWGDDEDDKLDEDEEWGDVEELSWQWLIEFFHGKICPDR